MANKFVSFLETIGRDFKKELDIILPFAATAGEVGVSLFAPAFGPMFNKTVSAIITAEQNAAVMGKQAKTGPQKLSSVVQLMGPLIAQGLADAGKADDTASVEKYISSIVTILNSVPAITTPIIQ